MSPAKGQAAKRATLSQPLEQSDDTPIWRYMDLAKFVALAFSRKLWFPKLNELWLADPWEGFGRAKGLKRPSRVLPRDTVLQGNVAQSLYAEFSGFAAQTVRNAHKHVYAIDGIPDLPAFTAACRKRSVFTDAQLKEFWDYKPRYRPFVLNFLFVYSLPKRPNLKALQENDIIKTAPRGFDRMSDEAFERLLKVSDAKTGFIVG